MLNHNKLMVVLTFPKSKLQVFVSLEAVTNCVVDITLGRVDLIS